MELATANKQLTNQFVQIKEQSSAITNLIKALPKSTSNAKGNRFGGNSLKKRIEWNLHGYCWSCGFHIDKNHNSVTGNSKKEGHQEAAT
eukprot:5535815-Ditylum_brightwellii.AAC.1